MNNEVFEELKKLMSYFPDSFINRQLELILIPKTNTYFSLRDCLIKNDVISKVLMWCTRDISKARPYQQQKRNIDFYVDNRTRLEKYLGSNINVDVVYHFSDLNIYSLRMLKDCSITKMELHSRPLSQPWMNWGTTWNGKCLTARISESPKIGNECSLSDILEENVPEEFFLSAEKISQLVTNQS